MNISFYRSMIQRYDILYDIPNKKQLQINDNMNTIFQVHGTILKILKHMTKAIAA